MVSRPNFESTVFSPVFISMEAAGAVGVLRFSWLEAGLADQRGLLIAEIAGDRNPCNGRQLRVPYTSLLETIFGSIWIGMPKSRRISRSHSSVLRFINCVRLALVTSVTWTPPSVRR